MDFQLGKNVFKTLYANINGYSISSQARSRLADKNKSYTYGEVIPESFYKMIQRVIPKKGEIFYDLGAGTGKATVLAAQFFEFSKCNGIEILEELYKTGKEILERFQHETHSFGKIEFIHSDFLDYNFSDGDVFFIHATCFPDNEMDKLTKKLERIKRGSRIITVTKNLNSDSFQELEHTDQQMSWGKATIYYYIRV